MARRRNASLAALVALALVACGGERAPSGNGDGDGTGGVLTLALDPTLTIGDVAGDPAYLFGEIRSVAVDDEGRVYVADLVAASVRVYSATGEFIERIAQEGEGPGEITGWPADLSFGPDGRLYVRDATR